MCLSQCSSICVHPGIFRCGAKFLKTSNLYAILVELHSKAVLVRREKNLHHNLCSKKFELISPCHYQKGWELLLWVLDASWTILLCKSFVFSEYKSSTLVHSITLYYRTLATLSFQNLIDWQNHKNFPAQFILYSIFCGTVIPILSSTLLNFHRILRSSI